MMNMEKVKGQNTGGANGVENYYARDSPTSKLENQERDA